MIFHSRHHFLRRSTSTIDWRVAVGHALQFVSQNANACPLSRVLNHRDAAGRKSPNTRLKLRFNIEKLSIFLINNTLHSLYRPIDTHSLKWVKTCQDVSQHEHGGAV